jgi:hypothetical protein
VFNPFFGNCAEVIVTISLGVASARTSPAVKELERKERMAASTPPVLYTSLRMHGD